VRVVYEDARDGESGGGDGVEEDCRGVEASKELKAKLESSS
jgi:hypothetical protein